MTSWQDRCYVFQTSKFGEKRRSSWFNVILKIFLKPIILLFQLPEPLLLHSNYEDLIRIALNQQENGADLQTLLKQLHAILEKLPKANRFTLRFIVEHLNRISLNEVWLHFGNSILSSFGMFQRNVTKIKLN